MSKAALGKPKGPMSVENRKKRFDAAPIVQPIYCIELNTYYKGKTTAQRETGIDNRHITECCRNNGIRKSAGKHPVTGEKLHWRYATIDEYNNYLNNLENKGD